MTVLAIDTASRDTTVCVVAGRDGSLHGRRVATGASVAAVLPVAIAEVVDEELEALVAVLGPGSYTGLRAGIAAAVGVATARGLPLHGLGALELLADCVTDPLPEAVLVRDAGRGWVYRAAVAGLDSGRPVSSAQRVRREAVHAGGSLLTVDAVLSPPATLLDHAACLAAAVPRAIATTPLPLDRVEALYVT